MSEFGEPWRVLSNGEQPPHCLIVKADDDVIPHPYRVSLTQADAERIAACVNALAGVPTEVLQRTNQPFATASWIIANAPETRDFARSLGHPDCRTGDVE